MLFVMEDGFGGWKAAMQYLETSPHNTTQPSHWVDLGEGVASVRIGGRGFEVCPAYTDVPNKHLMCNCGCGICGC